MSMRLFSFIGGDTGLWRVAETEVIAGEPLPVVRRLEIAAGSEIPTDPHVFSIFPSWREGFITAVTYMNKCWMYVNRILLILGRRPA
jgi:hypothetical protein